VERIPAAAIDKAIRTRVVIVAGALGLAASGLVLRLAVLQVFEAGALQARATRQHRQVIEVGGRRGSILDREGREFAVSVVTSSVYAHPAKVKDPDRAARILAPLVGRSYGELRSLLRSDEPFVWLQRRMDPKAARAIVDSDLPVGPGEAIGLQEEPKRFYPQGELAVHVVGFADTDQRGIEGIERQFDEALQGDSAKFLAVRDAKGAMLLQPLRPPAKFSEDVVLTIDLVLQHIVERELDQAMRETGAHAASAILLDPRTGDVLALTNRPTVDPRAYGRSQPESRRNRAVVDLYEPGSTFKIVSAAAAIERGSVTPEQRFACAKYTVAGKTYSDVHRYDVLSVREILEHSSNVGMVQVGRTIPREALRQTIVDFGFGRRTGIELPGERKGDIPSIARMSATTPAALSIGYEVHVTALQVASAFATIAHDGVLVPPRIVAGFRDASGAFRPQPRREPRRVITPRAAATMTNLLEGVVLHGTGGKARVPGYHIAGKTGTAKKVLEGGRGYTNDEYFASFGGYGPLRDPALVAFVVLDTPRGGIYYGGLVAAPVVSRILAAAFAYLRIPPDDDPWKERREELQAKAEAKAKARGSSKPPKKEKPELPAVVVTAPGQVPDVRGKSMRDAIGALAARGYTARPEGKGVVVHQRPAAGTALPAGQPCILELGPIEELYAEGRREAEAQAKAAAAALVAETRPGKRR
jgi:stage V sporulation protein D (sporulation-specific penicillin-binding protein)